MRPQRADSCQFHFDGGMPMSAWNASSYGVSTQDMLRKKKSYRKVPRCYLALFMGKGMVVEDVLGCRG